MLWNLCVFSLLLCDLWKDLAVLPVAYGFLTTSIRPATAYYDLTVYADPHFLKPTRLWQSQQQSDVSNANPPPPPGPISFELNFGGDNNVSVEIASPNDIPATAKQLSDQFGVNAQDVERVLQQSWDSATGGAPPHPGAGDEAAPPPYNGPTPTGPWQAECTIELPSGLVVELGPSTIGENAGRGIVLQDRARQLPLGAGELVIDLPDQFLSRVVHVAFPPPGRRLCNHSYRREQKEEKFSE